MDVPEKIVINYWTLTERQRQVITKAIDMLETNKQLAEMW